jgi:hypothetical protein
MLGVFGAGVALIVLHAEGGALGRFTRPSDTATQPNFSCGSPLAARFGVWAEPPIRLTA